MKSYEYKAFGLFISNEKFKRVFLTSLGIRFVPCRLGMFVGKRTKLGILYKDGIKTYIYIL